MTTALIIAADIFGRTLELEEIASSLGNEYADAIIIDPYEGQLHDFGEESEVYAFFTEKCGLKRYTEKLSGCLDKVSAAATLVGFSVGATAIWSIVGDERFAPGSRAACFYGSQIRDMVDVQPAWPTELIFPDAEPHFSIVDLMRSVCGKKMFIALGPHISTAS